MEEIRETPSPLLVVDIPSDMPPGGAQAVMVAPLASGYRILRVLDYPTKARVIYVHRDKPGRAMQQDVDGAVRNLYRQYPYVSVEAARKALRGLGLRVGTDRVRETLASVKATREVPGAGSNLDEDLKKALRQS